MSVNKIEDHLYISDYRIAHDADTLKQLDIKFILSVLDCLLMYTFDDITYKTIDVEDNFGADLISYFSEANEFIAGAQNAGHNVLVHCYVGRSRSATIVLAYLMQKYKWTVDEAMRLVSGRRDIKPNLAFMRQLQVYQQMNYTIDAKNRDFRRILIETIFNFEFQLGWKPLGFDRFDTYYQRMNEFEKTTEDFDSGHSCVCVNCSANLFSRINVIENEIADNDRSDPRTNCQWTYIEPQKWMSEQLREAFDQNSDSLVTCWQCQKGVVEHKRFFMSYTCDCHRHKQIGNSLRFRIANDAFRVENRRDYC